MAYNKGRGSILVDPNSIKTRIPLTAKETLTTSQEFHQLSLGIKHRKRTDAQQSC
jgi:hypothetical protein